MSSSRTLRHLRPSAAAALVAALVAATPGAAQAQATPDATTAALAVFRKAQELVAEQKYAEACPLFEETVRIEPRAIGARLMLADCYERTGRVASAWTAYSVAGDAAAAENQTERVRLARAKVDELRPHVPELTIEVGAEAQTVVALEIKRNGVLVGNAQWGLPVPVDPGAHVITAAGAGKKPWTMTIRLEAGEKGALEVPGLADEPIAPMTPLFTPAAPPGADVPQAAGEPPLWPWIVGGVGVALAGAATVFAIDGATTTCTEDETGKCNGDVYTQPKIDELNERRQRDVVLTAALGGTAVVALAVAVVGFATGGSPPQSDQAAVRPSPWVGADGAGLGMRGAF